MRLHKTIATSLLTLLSGLAFSQANHTRTDYLNIATKFADCMIEHGRDRYGSVHSPLFAVLLNRESPPRIGPYPLFKSPSPYKVKLHKTPFVKFDYNKIINYPRGLGGEGPHKITIFGCDPFEDRALYEFLYELTKITGDMKYSREADKALTWWFQNTQAKNGLYPWGEHLGWDFENESPTYFKGRSKHLYAACYHEIKDHVPFLDVLARLPAKQKGEATPLERYALGIWDAHFWDKDKAYFCRHGDYTGADDRNGSESGFPAHLAAYLYVWTEAYQRSTTPRIKMELQSILNKALDMAIARSRRYGFFPFDFKPELHGKHPGQKRPSQSSRLATHAALIADSIPDNGDPIRIKLKLLSALNGSGRSKTRLPPSKRALPNPKVRNLSGETRPMKHANAIFALLVHRTDARYIRAAERQALLALGLFCDAKSPLPKAHPKSHEMVTGSGDKFGDYYYRGAKLMHAFARLGAELNAQRK